MGLFVREISKNDIHKELYVYLRGRLLYKTRFVKGEKTASLATQSSSLNFIRSVGGAANENICQYS